MFASVRALLFGEDMSSDPVSKTLGFVLRLFSGGHLAMDVHLFSQYLTLAFIGFISISSLRCAAAPAVRCAALPVQGVPVSVPACPLAPRRAFSAACADHPAARRRALRACLPACLVPAGHQAPPAVVAPVRIAPAEAS